MRKFLQILSVVALITGLYIIYYAGTEGNWLAAAGWGIATVEVMVYLIREVREKDGNSN